MPMMVRWMLVMTVTFLSHMSTLVHMLGHQILITYKNDAITGFVADGQRLREIQ